MEKVVDNICPRVRKKLEKIKTVQGIVRCLLHMLVHLRLCVACIY